MPLGKAPLPWQVLAKACPAFSKAPMKRASLLTALRAGALHWPARPTAAHTSLQLDWSLARNQDWLGSTGALLVGLALVGLDVEGAVVVGAEVVGAAVEGAMLVGAAVVGALLVGLAVPSQMAKLPSEGKIVLEPVHWLLVAASTLSSADVPVVEPWYCTLFPRRCTADTPSVSPGTRSVLCRAGQF